MNMGKLFGSFVRSLSFGIGKMLRAEMGILSDLSLALWKFVTEEKLYLHTKYTCKHK